ncbi:hypothetical protein AGLY_012388 [Aphis glycines]|uniref:Uncharacterized protein n=1 Tax=Aphis glycines TaxID=307491 RepID=A0A6G0T9Y7_APHGL|nr:hypothetical protein AGLY_012388 [Aphis glycines]
MKMYLINGQHCVIVLTWLTMKMANVTSLKDCVPYILNQILTFYLNAIPSTNICEISAQNIDEENVLDLPDTECRSGIAFLTPGIYTDEFKPYALTICFFGTKVYRFLKSAWCLPIIRTLQRVSERWEINADVIHCHDTRFIKTDKLAKSVRLHSISFNVKVLISDLDCVLANLDEASVSKVNVLITGNYPIINVPALPVENTTCLKYHKCEKWIEYLDNVFNTFFKQFMLEEHVV